MTGIERESVIKLLSEKRDHVLRVIEGLTAAQMEFRAASNRWSAADCLEHIVIVEQRVLTGIQRALAQPPEPERAAATVGKEDLILKVGPDRSTPREAPEAVRPSRKWSNAELIREFQAARQRSLDFAAACDADLRSHVFPHVLFHDLDCYQWLIFLAAHSDRHAQQIAEIRREPGFPQAGERNVAAQAVS